MIASEGSGGSRAGRDRAQHSGWTDVGNLLGRGIGLIFTDRHGGISSPPYDTLNLACHTGDERDNVCANRGKVSEILGIAEERFIYLEQVHGLRVARAGSGDAGGGSCTHPVAFDATDGIYTNESGMVLSVLTADCVPIAIAEPSAGVVAMLHAGWKGTIGNIVGVAMSRMAAELRFDPAEAWAVMGPAIAPCCYEVDEGRARLFVEKYGDGNAVVVEEGGWRLDLFRANLLNLLASGMREENIARVGGCTCCENRYFSFRRDGVTGRQGAFVFMYGQE